MKKYISILGIIFLVSLPFPAKEANAACCGIVNEIAIINGVYDRIVVFWNTVIEPKLLLMVKDIISSIEKLGAVQAKTAESIATYQMQADVNREALRIKRELQAPPSTCQAMDNAQRLAQVDAESRKKLSEESKKMASEGLGSTRSLDQVAELAKKSKGVYMTPEDKARYGLPGKPGEYSGGDIDTNILFGSRDGSLTYDIGQEFVVDDMIRRKTMGGPESLVNVDAEKTSEGMMYRELQRKYAAFLSNMKSAYLFVKSFHTRSNLLNGYKSKMEIIDDTVKTYYSPDNIKNWSGLSTTAMLREVAAMDAARLWIEYQNMKYQERMLILLADQQAMLTEETVGARAKRLLENIH